MIGNQIQAALDSILKKLDTSNANFTLENYRRIKSAQSAAVLAGKLGLNEAMLSEFDEAIRQYYSFKEDSMRKRLAFFRISLWLETVCKNLSIPFSIDESLSNEEFAIKQVRALELIIRDIINEHLGGKESVLSKLKELFKQDVIDKWIKSADQSGVLSGTTFSELSNIFLDKGIFKSYEQIFSDERIRLSKSSRESLRYILEDIRLIRNSIAHNKQISRIQIEALNEYYGIIAEIIKNSQDNTINPDHYLDLTKAHMESFITSLREDNKAITGDLISIKDAVSDIRKETHVLKKRASFILVGVFLLFTVSGSILFYMKRQSASSTELSLDMKEVKNIIARGKEDSSKILLNLNVKDKYFADFTQYLQSEEYIKDSIIFYNFRKGITAFSPWFNGCNLFDVKSKGIELIASLDLDKHFNYPSHFRYALLAREEKLKGNFFKAIQLIDTALVFNERFAYSYAILSDCADNPDSSLFYINKAVQFDEFKFIYLLDRSQIYEERGDVSGALRDVNLFFNLYPKDMSENVWAIFWRVCMLFDSQMYIEACTLYNEMKARYPGIENCLPPDVIQKVKGKCNKI